MPIDTDGSQIAALMRKHHIALLTLAAADADTTLGLSGSFDLESVEVQDVLDQLAKRIKDVADTTRADVQRLTGQAAEHGWSPADLAREIRALGEIASQSRAELIGITESANAYNLGTVMRYEQSGQVDGVEVLDGTNDDICAAANGQIWSLDQARSNPTGHPRCVRSFAPVLSGGD